MGRKTRVISGDGHVETPPDAWVEHVPHQLGDFIPLNRLMEGSDFPHAVGCFPDPRRPMAAAGTRGQVPRISVNLIRDPRTSRELDRRTSRSGSSRSARLAALLPRARRTAT